MRVLGLFEVRGPKVRRGVPRGVNQGRSRGIDAASMLVTIAEDRWEPPLVDADWHAFCQAICKGIEGREWSELFDYCKAMSEAAGVKKPSDSQKARAFGR